MENSCLACTGNKRLQQTLLVFQVKISVRQSMTFKICFLLIFISCCFLICIQISQEAGQEVWYSHALKTFPQFVVIHTDKDFGTVNKAEIDIFLELSCFFDNPTDVGNLIYGSSAFSKTILNIWKFKVHILLKPALENFEHY